MQSNRFLVQHEYDTEPTYIVDTTQTDPADPDNWLTVAELPANGLECDTRLQAARMIADWLGANAPARQVVCIERHLVDQDDDETERYAEVDWMAEVLSRELRADGVHYQVRVSYNRAVGWYDEADFRSKFKFV